MCDNSFNRKDVDLHRVTINTVTGVAMLGVGSAGVFADFVGIADLIALLGVLSLIAAGFTCRMPDISR